jgi:hypothetical protein
VCSVRFCESPPHGEGVSHLNLGFHNVTCALRCRRGLCICLSSLTYGRGHSVVGEGLLDGAGGLLGPGRQP